MKNDSELLYKFAFEYLFDLLDDIDTAGDIAKDDDKFHRSIVNRIHKKRFNVGVTDGYNLEINSKKIKEMICKKEANNEN